MLMVVAYELFVMVDKYRFRRIFLVILLMVCFTSASDKVEWNNVTSKIIVALKKTALFFQRSYLEVNLDGIFGLRIAEGIIDNLLQQHKEEISKFPLIHSSTIDVFSILKKVGAEAVQKMEEINSPYYKMFKGVLRDTWYYQASARQYDANLVREIIVNEDNFNEEKSDYCMSNVLGSQDSGIQQKCIITDDCWEAVTMKGTDGYFLTHQAIYFIVIDRMGCREHVSNRLKNDDINNLFTDFGSNIFYQMKNNIENAVTDQDLFLEQCIVCNWLGVSSCNHLKWIKNSLEWQDESGCLKSQTEEFIEGTKSVGSTRKLNFDVVLKDGCSAHGTGLYLAFLANALHWLLGMNKHDLEDSGWGFSLRTWLITILIISIILFFRYFRKRILKYSGALPRGL